MCFFSAIYKESQSSGAWLGAHFIDYSKYKSAAVKQLNILREFVKHLCF
jgi:hypothetical protein